MRGFLEILNFSSVLILAGKVNWNARIPWDIEFLECFDFGWEFHLKCGEWRLLEFLESFHFDREIQLKCGKSIPFQFLQSFISAHNFNWNAENQFPPDFLQSFHFRPQFHFKCGKSTPLRYSFSAHTFNPNAENWNFFPLAFRPKLQTPSFLLQNLKFLAHSFFSCILFSSRIFPYLAVRSEWKSGKWVCETRKFWPRNEFLEGKCPNWKGIVTKILYKELLKELK